MHRAPPDPEKARMAGPGAAETKSNWPLSDKPRRKRTQEQLALDVLEAMSFWRLDLSRRIHRADICAELIGVEDQDIAALAREANQFCRVARAIKWLAGRDAKA